VIAALCEVGYDGYLSVEQEPEDYDRRDRAQP
jgi:sugar phosphate isomerase/epimerase